MNIPNLGRKLPNMGIKPAQTIGLADALMTRSQQRVLGILFSQPYRSFLTTELIAQAGVGTGAVQRELARLVSSGLVTVTPVGRRRLYQANREAPIFSELHGLILKTVGLAEPLRDALSALSDHIRVAFVYGSVAQGSDTARSDIDLMIIGEDVSYSEAYSALAGAEAALLRPINPTILTPTEWRQRVETRDHFAVTVVSGPRLLVLGSEDDLA